MRLRGSFACGGLAMLGLGACASGADPSAGFTTTTTTQGSATFTTSASTTGDSTDTLDTDSGGTSGSTTGDGTTGDPTAGTTGDPDDCGNGAIEGDEECDGGDLGGKTCETEGFGGGGLICNADCTLDTSACTLCGNGIADAGEDCDGADLGDSSTCADVGLGAANEALGCNQDCTYDYGECSGCGDGTVMAPEACEPPPLGSDVPDLNGETCMSQGYDGGTLDCTDGCAFDLTGCITCGDGVKNGSEECDSADFGGLDCTNYPSGAGPNFTGGSLSCDAVTCTVETTNCTFCGDAAITGNEACDGALLGGATCATEGFTEGTLGCANDCTALDTTACTLCGDGQVEGNETCDTNNFDGETCATLVGPGGGNLMCNACQIDTSDCVGELCGDGQIDGLEACDCGGVNDPCTAGELANASCSDFPPYTGGTLGCNSPNACTYDTSGCYYCGDGTANPGESCDGADLNGETCLSQGFAGGGVLGCTGGCNYDTSNCIGVTLLSSTLNTEDYGSIYLHEPYLDNSYIYIMVPGDMTSLDLSIDPHDAIDDLSVTLRDGATTIGSCAALDGALCDLGTIDVSTHNNRVLVAELQDTAGSYLEQGITVAISGNTDGLVSPLTANGTYRSYTGYHSNDYVLWPVGPNTGAFTYQWTDSVGVSYVYALGVMDPTGTNSWEETTAPAYANWHNTGAPTGWYMFAASSHESSAGGQTWSWTVTP